MVSRNRIIPLREPPAPVIVQIYEIQTPEEAEACVRLGVDHVGSVLLSAQEWRLPLVREAAGLVDKAGAKSSLIPLFRDPDTVLRAIDYYRPHFIHFCDALTDHAGRLLDPSPFLELQDLVRRRFPQIGIIRSLPVPASGRKAPFTPMEAASELDPLTDLFLTDTWLGCDPVEGFIGITGRPCDWDIAAQLVREIRTPVILAGGLGPENVAEALTAVRPAGADSCTGTNAVDSHGRPVRFKKDLARVKQFVEQVRLCESTIRGREGPGGGLFP